MGRKKSVDVEGLKKALTEKAADPPTHDGLLSTGSSLLNLACSGKVVGGFHKGHLYSLVGDSNSGKSFLSLTCMAEASIDPKFDNYRFIFNNPENSLKMDLSRFFGARMESRLETEYSGTIEEFYYHVDDCCKDGRPFIYVLDSMDALSADDEIETFQKGKQAASKGKEGPGSYGTAKSKINSSGLRLLMDPLRKSGSILILISQTRDNIGFAAAFTPKTRSGGKAIKFYASLEIWTSIREQIKKTIKGKPRQLGIIAQVQVKKNRMTGKDRVIEVPIYHGSGIDDVGGMIDWLVEEKCWPMVQGGLEAPEFDFRGKKEDLVTQIQGEEREKELQQLVQQNWDEIEAACRVERRNRYQ